MNVFAREGLMRSSNMTINRRQSEWKKEKFQGNWGELNHDFATFSFWANTNLPLC